METHEPSESRAGLSRKQIWLRHGRCLLSTNDDASDPAVRLYLRAGWQRLGQLRPGVQVMGRG